MYSAESTGQKIFRGSLGIVGLMGNGLAILKVQSWARQLSTVDTLVLASTARESTVEGVDATAANVLRNNISADDLGQLGQSVALVDDQADLPLPDGWFSKIVVAAE